MQVEHSSPKAIRDANAITLSNSIRRVSTPKTIYIFGFVLYDMNSTHIVQTFTFGFPMDVNM